MRLPPAQLRTAVPADATAAAATHRACWREAYGPYADPACLAERLADTSTWVAAWTRHLTSGPPRILAEVPGASGPEIVGFAIAGPARDAEAPVPSELYALYVREAWWGSGLSQRLWEAVRPDEPCSLWVLEDNRRARGFYRRNGFVPDGSRETCDDLGAWQVRMVRR